MIAAIDQIEERVGRQLGLRRVEADELSIERTKAAAGFVYRHRNDDRISARTRRRISDLVIPPAWSDVRIADDPDAHLQAIGRDDAGRLQYIYHDAWEDVRAATKAYRITRLGKVLGRIRSAVEADITADRPQLALATAVKIIDTLHLRAGHECYAGDEGGRGVATLLKRHLQIDGPTFRLRFRGKGGKPIDKSYTDVRIAAALGELSRLRGPRLLKVMADGGQYRPVTAMDINRYLLEISGAPVTAKDFRTLFASAMALDHLRQAAADSDKDRRKVLGDVAKLVSRELANTPAVARRSYIHPLVVDNFEKGAIADFPCRARKGQRPFESRLMKLLEQSAPAASDA